MLPFGFRIAGSTSEPRRVVDAAAALRGYASCDRRAKVEHEGYLSHYCFGSDFRQLLESTGSCKGYSGACEAMLLWWDIDREDDLQRALTDARRLAVALAERFTTSNDDLLISFSGAKGFHLGLPTSLWRPEPTALFNRVARRFAESVAQRAGVTIDASIYDKVRPFRAPNSRHPKTGRHKRRFSYDELMGLPLDHILQLSELPEAFDLPEPDGRSDQAAADWLDAERWVREQAEVKAQRRATGNGTRRLVRATIDFINNGAPDGERHNRLFQAAANLAEFDCPAALAHALLSEPALDSGLAPREVRRQIEAGLAHVRGATTGSQEKPQ
jgi:hypothetical protein